VVAMDRCWDVSADLREDEEREPNILRMDSPGAFHDSPLHASPGTHASAKADTRYCPGKAVFFPDEERPDVRGQQLRTQAIFAPDVAMRGRQPVELAFESRLGEVNAAFELGFKELREKIANMHQDSGASLEHSGPFTALKLEVNQLRSELVTIRCQVQCLGAASREDSRQGVQEKSADLAEALKSVDSLRCDLEAVRSLLGADAAKRPFLGDADWTRLVPALPPNAVDFTVRLDRGNQRRALGLTLDKGDGSTLRVDGVGDGGVETWNATNPTWAVRVGDRLVSVNGVAGDAAKMLESAAQSERVVCTVRRYSPSPALMALSRISPEEPAAPAENPVLTVTRQRTKSL